MVPMLITKIGLVETRATMHLLMKLRIFLSWCNAQEIDTNGLVRKSRMKEGFWLGQ